MKILHAAACFNGNRRENLWLQGPESTSFKYKPAASYPKAYWSHACGLRARLFAQNMIDLYDFPFWYFTLSACYAYCSGSLLRIVSPEDLRCASSSSSYLYANVIKCCNNGLLRPRPQSYFLSAYVCLWIHVVIYVVDLAQNTN